MATAADAPGAAAVDLAEFLVVNGTPFRQAHSIIGGLVAESLSSSRSLSELVRDHDLLGEEAVGLLEPGVSVNAKTTPGGAGPVPVAAQLARLEDRVTSDRALLRSLQG